MLHLTAALSGLFDPPTLVFTLQGNPQSEAVIRLMRGPLFSKRDLKTRIFRHKSEVAHALRNGFSYERAVVLFDVESGVNHFSPTHRDRTGEKFPDWACQAVWGVKVGAKTSRLADCASQVKAHFGSVRKMTVGKAKGLYTFRQRQEAGEFPWGLPRDSERLPTCIQMPAAVTDVLQRLNSGPNMAAAMADRAHAAELPTGSRISWNRVSPEALRADTVQMDRTVRAFAAFEAASDVLIRQDKGVSELLLAGVHVDPRLREVYLRPSVSSFSVRRPDLHVLGDGVFASENDEMPGGFPEAVHLDNAYGVNAERWERCFQWLCAKGTLVLLVSDEWSACYVPEMTWLAEYMASRGYPVRLLTTTQAGQLAVRSDGVWLDGARVGTIWRQFPIFEARGAVADLVLAAHQGLVRMVPEFAHFGNKAWFSVFQSHRAYYRQVLGGDDYALLQTILPESYIVRSRQDFPFTVTIGDRQWTADSREGLSEAPDWVRDGMVLKIVGANDMAARSYGVLMGNGIPVEQWWGWISDRFSRREPFIAQRRLEPVVLQMPVLNTRRSVGEDFGCRVLVRPWDIGGELVSASVCAVPRRVHKVHGMVDMCLTTVDLDA